MPIFCLGCGLDVDEAGNICLDLTEFTVTDFQVNCETPLLTGVGAYVVADSPVAQIRNPSDCRDMLVVGMESAGGESVWTAGGEINMHRQVSINGAPFADSSTQRQAFPAVGTFVHSSDISQITRGATVIGPGATYTLQTRYSIEVFADGITIVNGCASAHLVGHLI